MIQYNKEQERRIKLRGTRGGNKAGYEHKNGGIGKWESYNGCDTFAMKTPINGRGIRNNRKTASHKHSSNNFMVKYTRRLYRMHYILINEIPLATPAAQLTANRLYVTIITHNWLLNSIHWMHSEISKTNTQALNRLHS